MSASNESVHMSDSSSKPFKEHGNKVIKLANSIIALQNLVSDAEKRRNVAEEKLCDLRARLAEGIGYVLFNTSLIFFVIRFIL